MQAVENAKYYMKHKQKVRDIMSVRRESPEGSHLYINRPVNIKDCLV